MATLHIENVPQELYEALEERARQHQTSLSAEVILLLEENVPTASELASRLEFARRFRELQEQPSPASGPFPTAEEMLREDRER